MLAQAEVDGERLPEEIMISFLRQLVNAGGDTTYRGTSVLLTGLLSNPEQLEAVRKDRSLVPQAIEEALRWDGPVLIQTRMAAKDIELGGVKIPKGAVLDVAAGAANRDPDRFPESGQVRHLPQAATQALRVCVWTARLHRPAPRACRDDARAQCDPRSTCTVCDSIRTNPHPRSAAIMMRVPKASARALRRQ